MSVLVPMRTLFCAHCVKVGGCAHCVRAGVCAHCVRGDGCAHCVRVGAYARLPVWVFGDTLYVPEGTELETVASVSASLSAVPVHLGTVRVSQSGRI